MAPIRTSTPAMARAALVGTFVLGCLVSPASGTPAVTVKATPAIALAPATVQITVRVEPHRDNRLLVLSWLSPDGRAGSSHFQLDEYSRRHFRRELHALPPGDYVIEATLFRGRHQACARNRVRIR